MLSRNLPSCKTQASSVGAHGLLIPPKLPSLDALSHLSAMASIRASLGQSTPCKSGHSSLSFSSQVTFSSSFQRNRDRASAGSSIFLHIQSNNEGPNHRASRLAFDCMAMSVRPLAPVLSRFLLLLHTQLLPAFLLPPISSNTSFYSSEDGTPWSYSS